MTTAVAAQDARAGSAIDARALRSAMGRFVTGVTVVTNAADEGVHAMTANGFMSVSLDPPLVLVSLGNHTKMAARLQAEDQYGISVLANSQESLARRFAGSTHTMAPPRFIWVNQVPLVASALVHMVARVVDRHHAGDHCLFIGEVEHLSSREGEPLVFHTGAFRLLEVGVRESFVVG